MVLDINRSVLFQLNGNPANQKEDKVKMLTERINELVQQVRQSPSKQKKYLCLISPGNYKFYTC